MTDRLIPMPMAFKAAMDAQPDALMLTVDEQSWTRRQLFERAVAFAHEFRDRGVEPGQIVSILLPNCHDFIAAAIGAHMVAATPQPLSVSMAHRELLEILEISDPAVVVAAEGGPSIDREKVLVHRVRERSGEEVPEEFLTAVSKEWKAPTSGGSTGRPKVIVSAAPALIDPEDQALYSLTRLPLDSAVVIPGPLYHNGPFTFGLYALIRRNHLLLSTRFDAERTLAQIDRFDASYLYAVPTMMLRIARLPQEVLDAYDISTLKALMHLGAPCPAWLKELWMGWLGDDALLELYGGTEQQANAVITGSEWRTRQGSVGKAVAGAFKIVRDDGTEADPCEVGEIYLHTGSPERVTYRYIGAAPKVVDGGWETLGDIGWMDADGYLYLLEKRADLILRGGANIYPAEIEAALEEHPLVMSSAVVGLPDEDLGQRVHAIVQTEAELGEEELLEHLRDRLSRNKHPQSFEFVSEPIRDDSGKVRRSKLRDERSA